MQVSILTFLIRQICEIAWIVFLLFIASIVSDGVQAEICWQLSLWMQQQDCLSLRLEKSFIQQLLQKAVIRIALKLFALILFVEHGMSVCFL